MPEIDILPELKVAFRALNNKGSNKIDPTITKILLLQDKGEVELNVFRLENCKSIKPLRFQLYGSWYDENQKPIKKGEVCPEWQFSAKDSLLLNKNRFLYGYNEIHLQDWGVLSCPDDIDKNDLLDTEDEANPLLIRKLMDFLGEQGFWRVENDEELKGSGSVKLDLTDGSFSAELGEPSEYTPLVHVCNIFPTEIGIRLEEV